MRPWHGVHRFVVKIGSSVLTDVTGRLLPERLEQIAEQVARCAQERRQPILVSSGAVACGMASLGLTRRPKALAQLQACAAVGQGELMHRYTVAFTRHGLTTAQLLLTQDDLADRGRLRNAKQTLLTLLHRRVVPVLNENDSVSVEEISFGDNDRLAALVASALDAELLILLSDVDGVFNADALLGRIEHVHDVARTQLRRQEHETRKGGMASKLEAARIAGHAGIPMVIANGTRPGVLTQVLAGEPVGTLFVPPVNRVTPKKWRIAFALRRPNGEILIDAGAVDAVLQRGKSLLATGVTAVRGRFEAGAFVSILDPSGAEVARGMCRFSSEELARVRGMTSAQVAQALGEGRAREVVHRDHLVLARELHA